MASSWFYLFSTGLRLWHPASLMEEGLPQGLFLVPDPQCSLGTCFTEEGPTLPHHGAPYPAFTLLSRLDSQVQPD